MDSKQLLDCLQEQIKKIMGEYAFTIASLQAQLIVLEERLRELEASDPVNKD